MRRAFLIVALAGMPLAPGCNCGDMPMMGDDGGGGDGTGGGDGGRGTSP
jgi:hypothetical protein